MCRHPVGHDDRLVAVGHADVHLSAADELFAGQQLVIGEHLPVAGSLRDLHFGGNRQRHRPGGDHAHAEFGGGVDKHLAVALEIGAQSVEGVDHAAVDFNHAALQLGDVAVGQLTEQYRCPGRQPSGLQVDEVEFLLDAHRSRHDASHFATLIDA